MDEIQPPVPEQPPDPKSPQGQARRYLEARYGKSVWFRAPETFSPFEQWIWAVANGNEDYAERAMTAIEDHFREAQGT